MILSGAVSSHVLSYHTHRRLSDRSINGAASLVRVESNYSNNRTCKRKIPNSIDEDCMQDFPHSSRGRARMRLSASCVSLLFSPFHLKTKHTPHQRNLYHDLFWTLSVLGTISLSHCQRCKRAISAIPAARHSFGSW